MPFADPVARATYYARRNRELGRRAQKAATAGVWEKNRARDAPFMAIDSEGGSAGDAIEQDGKVYQPHKSFLWGCGDINGKADWLYTGRPISSLQICDWLIKQHERNKSAIFISFAFGYDVGQIVADIPYERAWEIQKGLAFDCTDGASNSRRITIWREFGLQYLKGKQFTLYRLRDSERPYRTDKAGRRSLDHIGRIRIYDVFGFFQSSFLKAIKSMPNVASEAEYQIVEAGKKERGNFDFNLGLPSTMIGGLPSTMIGGSSSLDHIKDYTRHELMLLCRMMQQLRQAMYGQNIKVTTWFGAGSIAQALLKRENVRVHLGPVEATDISYEQTAAHHAFFGGRIELVKQGCTARRLYVYDIASAYPAAATNLSSMEGGSFVRCCPERIRHIDRISIVRLQATFLDDRPFYPLPYRTPSGSILFPRQTRGWYMVDEVCAALDYCEQMGGSIEIEEVLEFQPASDRKPFAFLREMFAYRASLAKTDITQLVVKLGINSVYGKLAQSVGQFGKAPAFASPWHAAAITAWTRARLVHKALFAPDKIVMFATDGIVSMCRLPVEIPTTKTLGAWEAGIAPEGGVFVQSGVYTISGDPCIRGGRSSWTVKSRGFRPSNVTGDLASYMRSAIPEAWARDDKNLTFPYQNYMTLGASTVLRETWAHIGQWVSAKRTLDMRGCGVKREVSMRPGERRKRAHSLVPTMSNISNRLLCDLNGDMPMSAPFAPEWLDADFGFASALENEQEQILAGFS